MVGGGGGGHISSYGHGIVGVVTSQGACLCVHIGQSRMTKYGITDGGREGGMG